MNREIKFRIWNDLGKNMLYDVENVYECLMQQIRFDNSQPSRMSGINYDHRSEGMVWMQFTGLPDKDDKDIYHHDIVRLVEANRLYTVEYIDYGFKLVHADPKLDKMMWGPLNRIKELNFTIEVIGNKFSNPELLIADGK